MEIKPDTIEAVIKEALLKYDIGRAKYGPLSLYTDGLDFLQEAEAELLDCINYCVFQILRLRETKRSRILLTKDIRREAIERFLK